MNMETSSAPTMMVTIQVKASVWCTSSKVPMPDGEAIGNTENIQILKIILTRSGWMKALTSRAGPDKLHTSFHQSLISIMVRPAWYIIRGRHWAQHGRTNFFSLNSLAIRVALTCGHL